MKRHKMKHIRSCPFCGSEARNQIADCCSWEVACMNEECGARTKAVCYPDFDEKGRGLDYWDKQCQLKATEIWNKRSN